VIAKWEDRLPEIEAVQRPAEVIKEESTPTTETKTEEIPAEEEPKCEAEQEFRLLLNNNVSFIYLNYNDSKNYWELSFDKQTYFEITSNTGRVLINNVSLSYFAGKNLSEGCELIKK
jgi:hypothetical protein